MSTRGLWGKEGREAARTYKFIILPLVFLILGVGQPISFHFMPEILKSAAMPEGTIIEIPAPPPPQIVKSALDQFGEVGIFLVILATMGVVAREIETGQTAYLLTLGISRARYLLVKWMVLSLTVMGATLLGIWGAAYYTGALFGPVSWGAVTLAGLLYSLYGIFIVSAVIGFGTLFTNQLAAGGLTIALPILFSILSLAAPAVTDYLPTRLSAAAGAMLNGEASTLWPSVGVAGIWILLFLALGHYVLARREL